MLWATLPQVDREPPNQWEIAGVETLGEWFSLLDDKAEIDAAAARSLHEGLVTIFRNAQAWTLHDGKPCKVVFDHERFREAGLPALE
jgi:hypothetical protein